MSGPELQERLIQLKLALPIIFLTGYEDIPTTVRTLKAGGEDFLTKPVESAALINAVERAFARHAVLLERRHQEQEAEALLATLTAREHEVLNLIVLGNKNKQIGLALGTTERTIKAHRHNVMGKMKVRSLAELVTLYERFKLLG